MKLTLGMIKRYIDLKYDVKDIANILTMSGIEVEYNDFYDQFYTVMIKKIEKHPNADRLNICFIDYNDQELQIVCGASNLSEGMITAFAPIGTRMNNDWTMTKSKLRGIESYGMLCSSSELQLGQTDDGIISFDKHVQLNVKLSNILDNLILDFSITPNRGDLLSAYGIAREIAGLELGQLKEIKYKPQIKFEELDIENFFFARIENINLKTQKWITNELQMIGVKSISGPIDIANYIMYSFGQPMHVYDADLINDQIVTVQKANGEFIALNDKKYILNDMTTIKFGNIPSSIAGVIGSKNTAVNENTKNIIIESAFFDSYDLSRTTNLLNLSTEASNRFIKDGIDKKNLLNAIYLFIQYLDHGDVKYIKGQYIEENKYIQYNDQITIDTINKSIDTKILSSLSIYQTEYGLSIPSWRNDLNTEYDILNELLRKSQTDIEEKQLDVQPCIVAQDDEVDIHRILQSHGFNERITLSFGQYDQGIKLLNSDMRLRESLIYNLIEDYAIHNRYKYQYHGIYEIGNVFINDQEIKKIAYLAPVSNNHLAILEFKKMFDILIQYMTLERIYQNEQNKIFNHNVQINMNNGSFGLISNDILKKYKLEDEYIVACEIPYQICTKKIKRISNKYYTSIIRDVTFIGNMKDSLPLIFQIYNSIQEVELIKLKDIYNNSITLTISLRSLNGTLEKTEITSITERIFSLFTEYGFEIPGLS